MAEIDALLTLDWRLFAGATALGMLGGWIVMQLQHRYWRNRFYMEGRIDGSNAERHEWLVAVTRPEYEQEIFLKFKRKSAANENE